METTTRTTANATGPAACSASGRRSGIITADSRRAGDTTALGVRGGLEPPPPTRGLAPQASASAIPPLGPAVREPTRRPTRRSHGVEPGLAGCALMGAAEDEVVQLTSEL